MQKMILYCYKHIATCHKLFYLVGVFNNIVINFCVDDSCGFETLWHPQIHISSPFSDEDGKFLWFLIEWN